ncbi:MAG: aldehyde dehydrogenase family protein [Pirellulales bacterium]
MSSDQETISTSPLTGEVLGSSSRDTVEMLRESLLRARAVQPAWAKTPVKKRARAMLRVRNYVVEHAEELAETISRENGKTRIDALATEVLPAAMAANYYAKTAKAILRPRRVGAGCWILANKRSSVHRVPWGVIGVISPWNYPFGIPFSEVVMGLLAGNAVVLKVATQSQLVGRALERCFLSAGLPEGLFAYLNLPGPIAGKALLDAGINKLFFTGSVAVGKQLMANAAETLTPLCLELGGNDPMLVCPDADLERAAGGAVWAGMQNCGQSCGGVERIYVHKDVYEPFLGLLTEKVRGLRVGVDTDHRVDLGAMTTDSQMEIVRRHLQNALDHGATLFAQSECPQGTPGKFLPAVVLTDVDHSMLVMREETFGPVVGVMRVSDMDEAIRLANDSNLGLTASVWSRNRRKARELASQIQAGVVTINDHLMSHGLPATPWGGFKQSGLGRTHGAIGFAEMTQPQCIVDDVLPRIKRDLWWYPHGPALHGGIKGILELLYARRLSKRMAGLCRLLRILPRMFSTRRLNG